MSGSTAPSATGPLTATLLTTTTLAPSADPEGDDPSVVLGYD